MYFPSYYTQNYSDAWKSDKSKWVWWRYGFIMGLRKLTGDHHLSVQSDRFVRNFWREGQCLSPVIRSWLYKSLHYPSKLQRKIIEIHLIHKFCGKDSVFLKVMESYYALSSFWKLENYICCTPTFRSFRNKTYSACNFNGVSDCFTYYSTDTAHSKRERKESFLFQTIIHYEITITHFPTSENVNSIELLVFRF